MHMKWPLYERIVFSLCLIAGLFICMHHLIELRVHKIEIDAKEAARMSAYSALRDVVRQTTAQSVLIYDLKKNELVAGKSMDAEMSLASLTKIFTSALAYETFLKQHARDSKETRAFLERIQLMLTQSSNEEAEAIGLVFGDTRDSAISNLNLYAKPYGLTFKNLSGLDLKDTMEVGGRGVTVDLGRGIRDVYLKYPELFDKTILPYDDNTNLIAGRLDFFLAGKTGLTEYSGGNLAVIIQKGITHKYLVVVLGSTENGRFVDVEHIVKALLQLDL